MPAVQVQRIISCRSRVPGRSSSAGSCPTLHSSRESLSRGPSSDSDARSPERQHQGHQPAPRRFLDREYDDHAPGPPAWPTLPGSRYKQAESAVACRRRRPGHADRRPALPGLSIWTHGARCCLARLSCSARRGAGQGLGRALMERGRLPGQGAPGRRHGPERQHRRRGGPAPVRGLGFTNRGAEPEAQPFDALLTPQLELDQPREDCLPASVVPCRSRTACAPGGSA